MSQLTIKVEVFEGPLDLLLHLIKKMEIEITDIPITEVVSQYMSYLHTMKELELTIAGDYLVMAATLLSIKSAMLLPRQPLSDEEEDLEPEDPRAELALMLMEYQKYKNAAGTLQEKEQARQQYMTKPAAELSSYQETVPLLEGQVNLFDLMVAFRRVSLRINEQKQSKKTIIREEITIEEKMQWIRNKVFSSSRPILFSDLLESENRQELVTAFLALLELIKEQEISVRQETAVDDLFVTFNPQNPKMGMQKGSE